MIDATGMRLIKQADAIRREFLELQERQERAQAYIDSIAEKNERYAQIDSMLGMFGFAMIVGLLFLLCILGR